ncbi:MAG TPA: hypothetical protein IAB27_04255, partial [Candidatus Coprosoma intestinipullorum]|nr:hypothetical protein [Candidatus Coprosoma intestinipullorum]
MFGRYRLDRNGSARKREATSLGRRIFNGLGNALSAVALTGSLAAGVAAFAPTSYADEITQDQSMTQPVDNNTQAAEQAAAEEAARQQAAAEQAAAEEAARQQAAAEQAAAEEAARQQAAAEQAAAEEAARQQAAA